MYELAILNAAVFVLFLVMVAIRMGKPVKVVLVKRRGSISGAGTVLALIVLGTIIVVGAVIFTKNYAVLDGLRDSDFSAAANATIAGVETDFWSGLDLTRVLMILLPASAILGALFYYLIGRMSGGRGV